MRGAVPEPGKAASNQDFSPETRGRTGTVERENLPDSRALLPNSAAAPTPDSQGVRGNGGIVIPCYNHTDSLAEVIADLQRVVPSLPIVVIDDGSNPKVEAIPGVAIVRHATNLGKGAAILSGINHFDDRDYVVLVDGDGQHRADEIPQLLAAFDMPPRADVVTSSRDLIHDVTIPMRHRIANLLLSLEFAMLNGAFIRDVTNGLRVLRIQSLRGIGIRFHRYEVEVETLHATVRHGLVVRSVPTRGVRYGAPSSVGRGFRITATIALSMLAAKLPVRTSDRRMRHETLLKA